MLAISQRHNTRGILPKHELLEIYRGKILLHHTKTGYNYAAIQLPALTTDDVKSKLKTIATTSN